MKGREETAGAEQHRAHGQHGSPLVDPVQVASRHIGHADGSGRAVHELVSVPVIKTQSAFTTLLNEMITQRGD